MNMLPIYNEKSLPNPYGAKYRGIAFDGCYFYLLCTEMFEVCKYDKSFCLVECFKISRTYNTLCYDWEDACFWAASNRYPCKLFKLNQCFQEIDCIILCPCGDCTTFITGISLDCKNNRLIVAFSNYVVWVDKSKCAVGEVLKESCDTWNMGIVSVVPSFIGLEMKDSKQYIAVYNSSYEIQSKQCIPCGYYAHAIIFDPCTDHSDKKYHFYILVSKNGCYPHLIEWTPKICEIDMYCCNFSICDKCCDQHPCDKDCKCPSGCREQSCINIMESIALIEAALSHILNAEGEKMQKIIASTCDIDKILCANKAINETIVNATHLEIVLQSKLESVKDCFNMCDHKKHCTDKNCCELED